MGELEQALECISPGSLVFFFFKLNFKGSQFFLDSLDLAYPHKEEKKKNRFQSIACCRV